MASITGGLEYTGRIGGLSAYRMRGVNRIVLREKGGPSKQQIKSSSRFANTRMRNEEWKGSAKGVKLLNLALHGVRHLYDYNYTSTLSKICRRIQDEDKTNVLGRRSVLFSESGYQLDGFGLNSHHPFDVVVKHPLQYTINKQPGTATVTYADILPAIHLTNPLRQPFCRLVFVLSAVPDIVFDNERQLYQPVTETLPAKCIVQTGWQSAKDTIVAAEWHLSLAGWQQAAGVSLLLSAGIEYGQPAGGGLLQPTKYAGAAKILKLE